MATRKAITKALAVRYRNGSKTLRGEILDTVCGLTGYHRDYARRALRAAGKPGPVRARTPSTPTYDTKVVAALEKCWAVLNAPAGKRLAPMLAELVPLLRRHANSTSMTTPPPCWPGCRRPPSTGSWPAPGSRCCPTGGRTPSRGRS